MGIVGVCDVVDKVVVVFDGDYASKEVIEEGDVVGGGFDPAVKGDARDGPTGDWDRTCTSFSCPARKFGADTVINDDRTEFFSSLLTIETRECVRTPY